MFQQKEILILLAFSTALLVCSQNSFACTCAPQQTTLDAFERSDLTIIAKAVSIKKFNGSIPISIPAGHFLESVQMVVEKVYKGDVKNGEEIMYIQGGWSGCSFTFKEKDIGNKYLLYLNEPIDNHRRYYEVTTCERSNLLNYVRDDLLYLDNLEKVRGKTRISGSLGIWNNREGPGLSGRKIRLIQKDKIWETTTDKYGVFEVYDLPPGEYLIEPEIPNGWRIEKTYIQAFAASVIRNRINDIRGPIESIPILLEEKRHAGLDIFFITDNAIRGRILSPSGQPMEGVCLDVIPINGRQSMPPFGCTNINGEYEIDEIPTGKYMIAANADGKLSAHEPFETFYYPGTFNKRKAKVLSVGEGTFISGINMQIPRIKERIEISGGVYYSDGNPVANATISLDFRPDAKPEQAYIKTEHGHSDNGKFRLVILKGLEGTLLGTMRTYRGEFENCPALERIITESGKQTLVIQTNEVRISGTENLKDIQLSFPFPYCEKSKAASK
jgi:hypothetical protein